MHAATPQDRYNARVLVISVGGAIVVGTGLLYTARNYRLSRRGQVTDRFTVALERLGSSELYVRIGGVHALEHVMRDSADHHDDVIEVLIKFIRDRAPRRRWGREQVWVLAPELPVEPTPDIQAALTALAHRPHRLERQPRPIDLTRLHLAGADLIRADLTRADLRGADLTRATLTLADLTSAQLGGWNPDRAFHDGPGADLTGADLRGADLSYADLRGADLTRAQFDDADLTYARFDGAEAWEGGDPTRPDLYRARLTDAGFYGARLTGAVWPPDAKVPEGWRRDGPFLARAGRRRGGATVEQPPGS
jgi:hypothetical protein